MIGAFLEQTWRIWAAGGWLMVPLFMLAGFIYFTALDLLFRLRAPVITDAPYDLRTPAEVVQYFDLIRHNSLSAVNRRIRFLGVLTSAAPLMGLLGTVTGMLSTFRGMLVAGTRPLDAVAGGISEALITTQMGLLVCLPALVMLALISRRRNLLAHAIARCERSRLRETYREAA